jgi:segregation and condensation protein B
MSLKAKLEAVIYAAEEPVTLAQLAVLFAADALEWKAEREAASAAEAAEDQPVVNEEFAYLALDEAESVPLELAGVPEVQAAEQPVIKAEDAENHLSGAKARPSISASYGTAEAVPFQNLTSTEVGEATAEVAEVSGTEAISEASTEADQETGSGENAAAELEARRLARQRDREVRAILRQLLDELIANYASDSRGVEIREIAGGYRMATKPECHDAVRQFVKSLKPALRLSLPALETLAIIAYKQPVTAPEVNEIRGVDSSGVFGSLLARKLISTAGRKPVIGRPILYKTTREFLLRFGLKDVSELPSMEEFEKLAAIELDEEPEASVASEPRVNPALGPEFDEAASEELEETPSEEIESQTKSLTTETAETAVSNDPPPPAEA